MKDILDIITAVLGKDIDQSSNLENTEGWDSLKTLQIVMALDEAGYEIPVEKIAEIKSVQDILRFSRRAE